MSTVSELHERAMALRDKAIVAQQRGRNERAKTLFEEAYFMEHRAMVQHSKPEFRVNPSWAVMLLQLVRFALDAGFGIEAEVYAQLCMSTNPPCDVVNELDSLRAWNLESIT